ncbi:MAG TPA: hypothetical protein VH589_16875 [Trebonia sp.]|jgi:hypothetical protein
MTIHRAKRRLLGACVAGCGVAVLAACSSSSSSPSTSNTSAAASTPAATPASLAHLKTIVLQSADLPSGWKGTPHQPDQNEAADNAAMAQCIGARNTDGDKFADANSDDFASGNASISSSATSYKSQTDLTSDVQMLHSSKLSSCFEQMIKKQLASSLPAGSTIESASINITPGSGGGPSNVVATGTGTIKVKVSGQEVSVYLTVAFITGPLIEAEVDAQNVGSPVPSSVVNPLVSTVATRAAQG